MAALLPGVLVDMCGYGKDASLDVHIRTIGAVHHWMCTHVHADAPQYTPPQNWDQWGSWTRAKSSHHSVHQFKLSSLRNEVSEIRLKDWSNWSSWAGAAGADRGHGGVGVERRGPSGD
eukprot:scaffold171131_cov20-Tisochrysis_lutea.AAC.1